MIALLALCLAAEPVLLERGKSVVLTFPAAIERVDVRPHNVAEGVLARPDQLHLIGLREGLAELSVRFGEREQSWQIEVLAPVLDQRRREGDALRLAPGDVMALQRQGARYVRVADETLARLVPVADGRFALVGLAEGATDVVAAWSGRRPAVVNDLIVAPGDLSASRQISLERGARWVLPVEPGAAVVVGDPRLLEVRRRGGELSLLARRVGRCAVLAWPQSGAPLRVVVEVR